MPNDDDFQNDSMELTERQSPTEFMAPFYAKTPSALEKWINEHPGLAP